MKKNILVAIIFMSITLLMSCNFSGNSSCQTVGLALGGGGAKAAAEIGVIEELEQMGVKIDYVSGTSMGAVVGVLYAAGYSARELHEMWIKESWLRLFDKNEMFTIDNSNRSFFGVINGDIFEQQLRKALSAKGCRTFADLRIPFICVATRIVDKSRLEEIHLGGMNMDLARAVRASMTYPFPLVGYHPIMFEGMRLVDGGMMNNLPVDVVVSMGAERVIAVDLDMRDYNYTNGLGFWGNLLSVNDKLDFMFDVTDFKWLVEWNDNRPDCDKCNRNRRYRGLIHIRPDLDMFSILSFSVEDAQKMIMFGKEWTKKVQRQLKN